MKALRLYMRAPATYLRLAVVLQGPAYVLLGALTTSTTDTLLRSLGAYAPEQALCTSLGAAAPLLVSSLLSGALYVVLAAATTVALVRGAAGERLSLVGALQVTLERLRPLASGTLLAVAVVGLVLTVPLASLGLAYGCYGGTAALAAGVRQAVQESGASGLAQALVWVSLLAAIAYVVRVAVSWVVMPQVAVFEGGTAARILGRSQSLVRGRWGSVAGALLGLLLLQMLMAALLGLPFSVGAALVGGDAGTWLRTIGPVVAHVASLPIGALGTALLYVHLRG